MINHTRTLLLNVSAAGRPTVGIIGEEFIPSEFIPVVTNVDIEALRGLLLGMAPDTFTQNYRAAKWIRLVLAVPSAKAWADSLDTRCSLLADLAIIRYDVTVTTESIESSLHVNGVPAGDDSLGVNTLAASLRLTRSPDEVTVYGPAAPGGTVYACTDGVAVIPDIGLGLSAKVFTSGSSGASWQVSARARPSRTLPTIYLQLKQLDSCVRRVAVRIGTLESAAMLEMFETGDTMTDRLAAAVMLVVYATEACRNGV